MLRRLSVLKRLLGSLVCTQVSGELPESDGECTLYVLPRPALTDLAVLCTSAKRLGLPAPEDCSAADDDVPQFEFLGQNVGWLLRRSLMHRYPQRLKRAHQLAREGRSVKLVPVTVFWSRSPHHEMSFMKILLSERWTATTRLRRFFQIFLNRKLVHLAFAPAIDLSRLVEASSDPRRELRRTARLLRVIFKNQRLALIGPELSLKRRALSNVLTHPEVRRAIERDAVSGGHRLSQSTRRARRLLRGIVSDFSPVTIRWVYGLVAWCWKRAKVSFSLHGLEATRSCAQTANIVYLPCHQSHLDYIVLSFLLYEQGLALPHIASGDNLNLPVLGRLLRQCGAFYIRRSFRGDDLYRNVITQYVRLILLRGHSVEFFPEGTRSRTGFLMPPKLGMLQVTLNAAQAPPAKPLALIPVRYSFERLLDGESFAHELTGACKQKESWMDLLRGFFRMGRGLGRIGISFGEPIVIDCSNQLKASEVATQILAKINQKSLATASHLLALALLGTPRRRLERNLLQAQMALYIEWLDTEGFITLETEAQASIAACERQGLVQFETLAGVDFASSTQKGDRLLPWHRNNALHSLAFPALLALLSFSRPLEDTPREQVSDLWNLIAKELHQPKFSRGMYRKWLSELRERNFIQVDGGACPAASEEGRRLKLLARLLVPTLERHLLILDTANSALISQPFTRDALIAECLRRAAHLSEFLSEPLTRDCAHLSVYALLGMNALTEQPDGVRCADPATRLLPAISACLPEESLRVLMRR